MGQAKRKRLLTPPKGELITILTSSPEFAFYNWLSMCLVFLVFVLDFQPLIITKLAGGICNAAGFVLVCGREQSEDRSEEDALLSR